MAGSIPFVSEVPTIEIRGQTAIIRSRSGNQVLERAMSCTTLAKFVERGQRALRQHAEGDRSVHIDD